MLHGFITERDLAAIEEAFPGIWRFYSELTEKPCTFLELVWRFACDTGRGAADVVASFGSSSPARL
jgi:hypothetical protein